MKLLVLPLVLLVSQLVKVRTDSEDASCYYRCQDECAKLGLACKLIDGILATSECTPEVSSCINICVGGCKCRADCKRRCLDDRGRCNDDESKCNNDKLMCEGACTDSTACPKMLSLPVE